MHMKWLSDDGAGVALFGTNDLYQYVVHLMPFPWLSSPLTALQFVIILPVLWITSRFQTMGSTTRYARS